MREKPDAQAIAQPRFPPHNHIPMNTQESNNPTKRDINADPLTGEPGAHPVATGVGAAGAGAAGAAIGGAVGGPVGAAVGAVIGAVAGGYGGKAVGEVIDPTAEDAFWREEHERQSWAGSESRFEDYQPAYRAGYQGYDRHAGTGGRFEDAETQLHADYERDGGRVPWEKARAATRAAWNRVESGQAKRRPVAGAGGTKG